MTQQLDVFLEIYLNVAFKRLRSITMNISRDLDSLERFQMKLNVSRFE